MKMDRICTPGNAATEAAVERAWGKSGGEIREAVAMSISELTRRNIVDHIRANSIKWCGRLEEIEFLSRLFDLKHMPSYDGRFKDAAGDIFQHRVNNFDWDEHWVFSDGRFKLLDGSDENFTSFLCEMLHPVVRDDPKEVSHLLKAFNQHLRVDRWRLYARDHISRRSIFGARPITFKPTLRHVRKAVIIDADYIHRQINRMESALEDDSELAIGTAKELVETVCKTILAERGKPVAGTPDMPTLTKETLKELKLVPDAVPDSARGSGVIKRLLSNLGTIGNGLAELRGLYGTGHGKHGKASGLSPRHAKLAVGAAATLITFLLETHKEIK
jgi:hypothetical protein